MHVALCSFGYTLFTVHFLLASAQSAMRSHAPIRLQRGKTAPFEAGCGTENSIFEGGNLPSTRKPAKAGI